MSSFYLKAIEKRKKNSLKKSENCWEFINCPEKVRNNCDVYKLDAGNECWLMCKTNESCGLCKNKECFDCEWFKKNNPDF